MADKILLVDDDRDILDTFKRLLRKKFPIDTALNADKGLEAISSTGPYAVIVSDMRMPGMDGVEFLSKVKEIAPDTVRIMLTGNADMQTAVDAVNKGRIFRFLNKPCSPELFTMALSAGLEQHRLILAERDVLEKTLSHSIKVLIDILSIVNPVAFGRATRLRRYVRHMASALKLKQAWQYELAAMLSQIGCVTIPQETIEKYYAGQDLSDDEREMFAAHPSIGREFLERVPRLEPVSLMIGMQDKPFSEYQAHPHPSQRDETEAGAQMLKVAIEFDRLVSQGGSYRNAIDTILLDPEECDPVIASTLRNLKATKSGKAVGIVKVMDVRSGMFLGENIYTKNGLLLAPKGQEITHPLKERLKNFLQNGLIEEQIRILIQQHDFKK